MSCGDKRKLKYTTVIYELEGVYGIMVIYVSLFCLQLKLGHWEVKKAYHNFQSNHYEKRNTAYILKYYGKKWKD